MLSLISAYIMYIVSNAAREGFVGLVDLFSVSNSNLNWLTPVLWGAILIASAFYGYRVWSENSGMFPGVLSATPYFGKSPTNRLCEHDLIEFSMAKQILTNIALSTCLQLLFAIQRIRNWIPDSQALRKRLDDHLLFANQQKRWHSITEYEDREALDYLIRMGKLSYSPTKQQVKIP